MSGLSTFEFKAMGSPCEIRLYADNASLAASAIREAVFEINRLEEKYSRYKDDNLLHRVNEAAARGASIDIDDEFVSLLEYADTCYEQSDGLFDITSGILRKAWDFKKFTLPDEALLQELLASVGWRHLSWEGGRLCFDRSGMEIDFGGVVKEYAADAAANICLNLGIRHGIVNMGGDIRVIGPQPQGEPWPIRIQHPRFRDRKLTQFNLTGGALASSGDYERYVEINGERYSHILSPVTGWPVKGLAAVTVVAEQCVVAGSACTIAMLKEGDGPGWLSELGAPHIWMDTQLNSGGLGPGSAA